MGLGVSGGVAPKKLEKSRHEKLAKALVIEDVRIIERDKIVEVPRIKYIGKEVEYEIPVLKKVPTVKYNVISKETVKYIPREEETIKYAVKEVPIEKPIVREREYEKPVTKDVEYERPVIIEKTIEVVRVAEVKSLTDLRTEVQSLRKEITDTLAQLSTLKKYVLVEKVVEVPKIEWVTVQAERIVWKDVERIRPVN